MAVPLRSNIFKPGTREQQDFAHFPVRAAVLFSPTDSQFLRVVRDLFLRLDQLTGENVVFFAVLDPPDDWKAAAQNRQWWQGHQTRVGKTANGERPQHTRHACQFAKIFGR